jgi:hypothetical protein
MFRVSCESHSITLIGLDVVMIYLLGRDVLAKVIIWVHLHHAHARTLVQTLLLEISLPMLSASCGKTNRRLEGRLVYHDVLSISIFDIWAWMPVLSCKRILKIRSPLCANLGPVDCVHCLRYLITGICEEYHKSSEVQYIVLARGSDTSSTGWHLQNCLNCLLHSMLRTNHWSDRLSEWFLLPISLTD